MFSIRKIVTQSYDNVSIFLKNEEFTLRVSMQETGKINFSIHYIDPISKVLLDIDKFQITIEEYTSKYDFDEEKLRSALIQNPKQFGLE